MRECPCCGHKDSPIWRNKRFRIFTSYCHLDELKDWEPELWTLLVDHVFDKQVKVGHYIYHVTKARYVDRIHEQDSMDGQSWREPEQEKRFKFSHPAQKKLLMVYNSSEKNSEAT